MPFFSSLDNKYGEKNLVMLFMCIKKFSFMGCSYLFQCFFLQFFSINDKFYSNANEMWV